MIGAIDLAAVVACLPILGVAALDDYKNLKIRNKYVVAVLAIGVCRLLMLNSSAALFSSMLSGLIAAAVFYAGAYHYNWLGGGDVKMIIALSLTLPYQAIPPFYFSMVCLSLAWCAWRLYNKKEVWRVKAALAPYLLAANIITLLYLLLF